jgi:hypothetical protein
VRLCSAARQHLAAASSYWDAFEQAQYERILSAARLALGAEVFAREQARGEGWTYEQAIAYAMEQVE